MGRRGGSSGSSGSTNSNSSTPFNTSQPILLGGYNFGFNQNSTSLTGSHFKDPILVSAITINGICVLFFFALVVVTCCIKTFSWRAKGRRVFAVLYGLVVAMFLAYLRTLADEILHELGLNSVVGPYLALAILKQVFANATDTTLIFVIYSVLKNRYKHFQPSNQDGDKDRNYTRLKRSYMTTWILIFLFGLADEGLFFNAQGYITSGDTGKVGYWVGWYKDIHLSYVTLYFTIALEIFYRSFTLSHATHKKQQQNNRISDVLLWMIAPFLLLRSLANVALSVYYIMLGKPEEKYTAVVTGVLLGLTSVVVYVGLVIIAFEKDWDVPVGSAFVKILNGVTQRVDSQVGV